MVLKNGNAAVRIGIVLAAAMLLAACSDPLNTGSKPTSRDVDLAPAGLVSVIKSVPDGGTIAVSLTLDNLLPGAQAFPFSVDFHLALTGTFSPGTDPIVGSVIVPSGPAGDSALVVAGSVSIPAGALNQAVYIYAVVDSAGAVTETSTVNNTSTVGNAQIVNVYDSTLPILVETYSPSGSGSADTIMALYKNVAGVAVYQGLASNEGGPGGYAAINAGVLGPGTYYVTVVSWNPGPYAFAVRTAGFSHIAFGDLASNAQDPYEPDDAPSLWPVTQDLSIPPLPSQTLAMTVGGMSNRYSGVSDWDWFTFTLP